MATAPPNKPSYGKLGERDQHDNMQSYNSILHEEIPLANEPSNIVILDLKNKFDVERFHRCKFRISTFKRK